MENFKAKGKYRDYLEFFANNGYSMAPDFKAFFVKNDNENVIDHYNKMQDYTRAHLENFGRMYKATLMNHPIFNEVNFNSFNNSNNSKSQSSSSKEDKFSNEKNNLWEMVDFINKVCIGVIQTISLIQQQYITYLFQEFGDVALRAASGNASNGEAEENISKAKEFSKRTAEYLSSIANISMKAQKEIFEKLKENKNYKEAEENMKNMKKNGMWSDFEMDDFYSSFTKKEHNSSKSEENFENENFDNENSENKNTERQHQENGNFEKKEDNSDEIFSKKENINKENNERNNEEKYAKKMKTKSTNKKNQGVLNSSDFFDRSTKKEKDEIDEFFE